MSCIGTAGHIDHGKSTLVEALTGIDPDRLLEEKVRGMTIDLGFAWLTLPSGRTVSVVDVPGHEGFIKHMLAGVGGIDAALLVVAADEGVMPQTREHLAILDLLCVSRGLVALTKADLVDEEWLALVRAEVREHLQGTSLQDVSIIPVSARTRQGLPELLREIERVLAESGERPDLARPRLPVDRVFTMTGFGTVVTGTLLDGTLRVGQEVEILPQGLKTRIRTLQTHRQQIDVAYPGTRVAINLAGIARQHVSRGNVIACPGQLQPSLLLDARLQMVADAPRPLLHNAQVDFYSGAQEIQARIRLLEGEQLEPGQQSWVQLRLNQPAVVARRDHFIVRFPSPSATIGGGEIIDIAPRYHRRRQASVLQALATLARGAPDELILAVLHQRQEKTPQKPEQSPSISTGKASVGGKKNRGLHGYALTELARQSNLSLDVTVLTLETLLKERRVKKVGEWWFAQSVWEVLCTETIDLVSDQHRQYPLRGGLSKEEWRTRLGFSTRMAVDIFQALQEEGVVAEATTGARVVGSTGGLMRLPGFVPELTREQRQRVERLLRAFRAHPYQPPGRAEIEALIGGEELGWLLEQGLLVRLGSGSEAVFFLRETYDEAIAKLVDHLHTHQTITAAEARDILGTTRKYVLPLLEHMDEQRITLRRGDLHLLGSG